MATDLRALGRLGSELGTLQGRSRRPRRRSRITVRRGADGSASVARRPRVPRSLTTAAAVTILALAWLGQTASQELVPLAAVPTERAIIDPSLEASLAVAGVRQAGTPASAGRMVVPGTDPAAQPPPPPQTVPFAAFDDLPLHLPVAEPLAITFRQAPTVEALPLAPVGSLMANDNPAFRPPRRLPGPDYRVAAPVDSLHHPTSAVHLSTTAAAAVLAPTAAEVVAVTAVPDDPAAGWQVVLRPDTRPDLHVVVGHLLRPGVVAGQRVALAEPLGVAAQDPAARAPHVTMKLQPAVSGPLDPHAPAVP